MKLMKYELIKEIMEIEDQDIINTFYEIIVNHDYDYIVNLFNNFDDFKEFIEKYKEEE